ncbi:DNA-binding transcriptional MerR regulator [Pseudonocardia endophytica]|uniref:DNA-binding transcriptional MerR regulator n=1 Tax=Pseudonocardia endophytica TaxID=401976 RepID=A0A4R1HMX2_PSEEN|nr:DNA-binding transcriptional MerR regulator [Pseudonocardia endophytica]
MLCPVTASHTTTPVSLTIGQLARRTGVPVRTIRFWSDEGLVPSDRTASGYRCYDAVAVARLDLVRTLRDLGMGLEDVREVLARRRGVDEVASAHVRAIDEQIRALRVQRAVCTLLARGDTDDRGMILMNDLARLSAAQRQQMIDDFVDDVFAGVDDDAPGAGIANGMKMLPAELPDDPTQAQVQAWVELAELVGDPAFKARCREMAVEGSKGDANRPPPYDACAMLEHAEPARATGVAPGSAEAEAVLGRIGLGELDASGRAGLAGTIETFSDRRVERYWELLGVLNGWPARETPPSVPAMEWVAAALRA